MCGGLNVVLMGKVIKLVKELKEQGMDVEAITIGKKGRDLAKRSGITIAADFSGITDYFTLKDIFPIAKIATEDYTKGSYRKIYIAFTQFINTLNQNPIARQILPLDIETFKSIAEYDQKRKEHIHGESKESLKYILEPDTEAVFKKLVPHLIETSIYKAILESEASEHSARMIAMKNATDKAGELLDDLNLAYNQARQASITSEIAEISSGAMATAN